MLDCFGERGGDLVQKRGEASRLREGEKLLLLRKKKRWDGKHLGRETSRMGREVMTGGEVTGEGQ